MKIILFIFFILELNAQSYLVKPETETEPVGLFASPAGLVGATGTYGDPMDLEYALSGTAPEVVDGSTLLLLSGKYTKPWPTSGYAGQWIIDETNITLKPYVEKGYPVIINGAFKITNTGNTIKGLYFYSDDPVPGGEPTPPGSFPSPTPTNWSEWGYAGVFTATGADDTLVAYNIVNGGAGCFTSFSADNVTLEGNITYNFGWEGADRMHGHGMYIRPEIGQTMHVKHNMMDNSRVMDHAGNSGNSAMQLFTTSPIQGSSFITFNAFKDGVTAQSEQKYITYLDFSNNVCEATDISTAGDSAYAGVGLEGISPYNPPGANAEILHGNNTYINILHSVLTNPWTASTSTNSRIFKTKSVWDQMTKRPAEEGTFTDISTPSTGVDEYRIWVNPVINSKRANTGIPQREA